MKAIAPVLDITGKCLLITGGGRGLGRAFALGLARAGANVAVAGRTGSDAEAVAREIAGTGASAFGFAFDAQQADQCSEAVGRTIDRFGRLDGIVVNHGVTLHASALDTTPKEFREIVDINLSSAFFCAQAAARAMRAQPEGGSMVLISSNASFIAYPKLTAYASAKGGLDQLCRQLAFEWAPHRIRVNAIGPGYMNSHMRGVEAGYEDPVSKARILEKIPMARRGDPEELVGAAIYLLSEASSYCTGQYLAIDGGYSLA